MKCQLCDKEAVQLERDVIYDGFELDANGGAWAKWKAGLTTLARCWDHIQPKKEEPCTALTE